MSDKKVYKPCPHVFEGKTYDLSMVMSRVQLCEAILGRPNGLITAEELDKRCRVITIPRKNKK